MLMRRTHASATWPLTLEQELIATGEIRRVLLPNGSAGRVIWCGAGELLVRDHGANRVSGSRGYDIWNASLLRPLV